MPAGGEATAGREMGHSQRRCASLLAQPHWLAAHSAGVEAALALPGHLALQPLTHWGLPAPTHLATQNMHPPTHL